MKKNGCGILKGQNISKGIFHSVTSPKNEPEMSTKLFIYIIVPQIDQESQGHFCKQFCKQLHLFL